jgi:hypothetical protein
MFMKRIFAWFLLSLGLTQCESTMPDGRPQGRQERYVSMPVDLNERERQYIRSVADTLVDYGFRPTRGGGAQYSLNFSIEEGPINTDTSIYLYRRGSTVAMGEGRDGGPQSIFDRAGVVRRSFNSALSAFSEELDDLDDDDEDFSYRGREDYGYGRDYPGYPPY